MISRLTDLQKRHEAELKAERDEVSRLREELKTVKSGHAAELRQMGLAAAEQKKNFDAELKKISDLHAAAEKELAARKAEESGWLNDLNKVNHAMSSE